MIVYVSQIYGKPGVSFPFSHLMQGWMTDELSALAKHSTDFASKYGADFNLGVNLSADKNITDNQIKGPAIFKKTKDVEYTLFLPYDVIIQAEGGCRTALGYLLDGIRRIFVLAGVDPTMLDERRDSIITHICSDPTMLNEPWPDRSGLQ